MNRVFLDGHVKTFQKSPNEVLDYVRKATVFLDTDTISTSTWTTDNGITVDSSSNDTDSATVWLSGGTDGNTYKVTNKIVTATGRTKEQHFFIKVIDPEAQQVRDYQYNM